MTNPEAGHRGMSVLVVDRGAPGLHIGKKERKMGVRGLPVNQVVFEECEVPAENLLGQENEGFGLIMKNLNSVRPVVAARLLTYRAALALTPAPRARKRPTCSPWPS
jgi:alkylation response protein AidB-like acyl-CoA dehydrogenase